MAPQETWDCGNRAGIFLALLQLCVTLHIMTRQMTKGTEHTASLLSLLWPGCATFWAILEAPGMHWTGVSVPAAALRAAWLWIM
jgi:hypothetical protein